MTPTREIPLKQWFHEEAAKLDMTPWGFAARYYRGEHKGKVTLRMVNKRVVWVVGPLPPQPQTPLSGGGVQ